MDAHRAVLHLAAISVVLPGGPHGLLAALDHAGLIDASNRLRMRVVPGHDLLASITQFLVIPLNGFEEPL
jgi:hypothetical protein